MYRIINNTHAHTPCILIKNIISTYNEPPADLEAAQPLQRGHIQHQQHKLDDEGHHNDCHEESSIHIHVCERCSGRGHWKHLGRTQLLGCSTNNHGDHGEEPNEDLEGANWLQQHAKVHGHGLCCMVFIIIIIIMTSKMMIMMTLRITMVKNRVISVLLP